MFKSWLKAGCLLLGLACAAREAGAATVHVQIHNFFFSPKIDTIILQDSVVWNNVSSSSHSAVSDSIPGSAAAWHTSVLGPGGLDGVKFTQLGVHRYICGIHGSSMTGRIVVISPSPVRGSSWSKLRQLYRGAPRRLAVSGRPAGAPRPD